MFKPELAAEGASRPERHAPAPPTRVGSPVDVRRVFGAFKRARRRLLLVALLAGVTGGVLGRFVIRKTYAAEATILWEPPAAAKTEALRELSTLSQSVKLPANLLRVRDKLHRDDRVEALARDIDVTLGENSMLISITARQHSSDDAATVANAMVDVFVDAQHDVAANRLREGVIALRQSLAQSSDVLETSHREYDRFRSENHVGDFSAETQAAIAELARLRVSAHDAQIELQGLRAREISLKRSQSESASSVLLSQTEADTNAARLGQAETELAALRAKYSDDHPLVAALAAEVEALKARRGTATPAVTAQTSGRNPTREALTIQLEESSALVRAVEERSRALADVQRDAESRSAKLTAIQGEAARLLADVTANEEHVAVLLKQIAMAEDDVRGASSGFQVVSRATPPEHSERGIGRIVAVAVPLVALLFTLILALHKELAGLRAKTASEVAYWSRSPVLGSLPGPKSDATSSAQLGRDLADVIETRNAVLGIAGWSDEGEAIAVVQFAVARLERRGRTCTVVHALDELSSDGGASAADALESYEFVERLAQARAAYDAVLVVLPPVADVMAVRAAMRTVDGLVVVARSSEATMRSLATLHAGLGVESRGVAFVLRDVPYELYSRQTRKMGDPRLVWRDARARVRASAPRPTGPSAPGVSVAPRRDSRRSLRIVWP